MKKQTILTTITAGYLAIIMSGSVVLGISNCDNPPEQCQPEVTFQVMDIQEQTSEDTTETSEAVEETTDVEPEILQESPEPIETSEPQETVDISNPEGWTDDMINMLCLITMSESGEYGAQPELGQRMVIDTILNRMDDPRFPSDFWSVIYSPNQYDCVYNRVWYMWVQPEIKNLVLEEIANRTDDAVLYFCSTGYFYGWCTPYMQVGGHYFSY